LDSAWDPSSEIPCPCEASRLCICDANIPQRPIQPDPKPGVSEALTSSPCYPLLQLFEVSMRLGPVILINKEKWTLKKLGSDRVYLVNHWMDLDGCTGK
jgi:hypothetical protein